jgi:2-polyprenyl-3-methyl-5-hydroxy-6-metoxy-1,4-benzoquinol methylase
VKRDPNEPEIVDQLDPIDLENYVANAKILNLGCGNSKLPEEMYEEGFRNIKNIDYVESCIT